MLPMDFMTYPAIFAMPYHKAFRLPLILLMQ